MPARKLIRFDAQTLVNLLNAVVVQTNQEPVSLADG
jgi:hypothetical protein